MKLYELTAHDLRALIISRKVSAVEITKSILDRIDEVDRAVGSYITICREDAIKRAGEIQAKIDKGESNSKLAGIPAALKDNICIKGIRTTCASKMLENFIPPYSATAAQKLYSNDTILLGKLNMDEFAMGSSTESSYFKITRNPWDLERVPGGSSGGSATAVAAGQAIFTLGSDTGGSIREPAAFCGVVGMKPTYGVVSRYGLIPFASSLDQIGPITKDVEDCALVLNTLAGHDEKDSTSADIDYSDYTKFLVNNVKGLKIGIPKEYVTAGLTDGVRRAVYNAIDTFKMLGAECEEFSFPVAEYVLPAYYIISSAEASSNLARFDGIKYGYRAKEYTDLQDMYRKSRGEGFGSEVKKRIILGTIALSDGFYKEYYQKALKARTMIIESFSKAFEKYDIIINPSTPTTAYRFNERPEKQDELFIGNYHTAAVNLAGLPAISIPCGFDTDDGLPVGLQLIAKPYAERTLLRAAYTFEQNTEGVGIPTVQRIENRD